MLMHRVACHERYRRTCASTLFIPALSMSRRVASSSSSFPFVSQRAIITLID